MDIATAKARLNECELKLDSGPLTLFCVHERNGRSLKVSLTPRLRKHAKKAGLWRSQAMLVTLTNARYGFDPKMTHSVSGRDGLFVLDRTFRPPNEMMRKLFDRFIDNNSSEFLEIVNTLQLGRDDVLPVRLVSHHLRLLGLLAQRPEEDHLVLVDCDRTK